MLEESGRNEFEVNRTHEEETMARTHRPKVLFVAAEASPLASVGGLAEVVRFLPRALRDAGNDVRIAIPDYQPLLSEVPRDRVAPGFQVQIGGDTYQAQIKETVIDGQTPVYLVASAPGFNQVENKKDVYRRRKTPQTKGDNILDIPW
jgi:glycogen synthase